ncbi:MAG: hypothetical protein Q7V88_06080 [Actinomycetota bacterium]|nr:hypothetical protein [Actinomycetota bacterium]
MSSGSSTTSGQAQHGQAQHGQAQHGQATPGPSAARHDSAGPCLSCGSSQARTWGTGQGAARLCPPCATLHGLGCP